MMKPSSYGNFRMSGWALLLLALVGACGGPVGSASINDPPPSPEESAASQVLIERKIRRCVEEAGFQYIEHPWPVGFHQASFKSPRHRAIIVQEDREYASRYGYGWTETIIATYLYVLPNPNSDYMERLDEDSQERYWPTVNECRKKVRAESGRREDLGEAFAKKTDELDRQILSHGKVLARLPDWSECMREQGYEYYTLEDPVEDVKQKINQATGGDDDSDYDHTLSDEFLREQARQRSVTRLREFQPEEAAIAVADTECRERTGLLDALAEVREELDAEFDRDNVAFLSEARNARE